MAGIVYFAHSYRPEDAEIVDYFARLIEADGLLLSLDPPSNRVNTAKLERHLLHSDAMVVVLTQREPAVSPHLLYEMSLAVRFGKPLLVFVEDTLPRDVTRPRILQTRFSRKSFIRDVREHRHALGVLRAQLGDNPPPSHRSLASRRGCLLIGAPRLGEAANDVRQFLQGDRQYDVLSADEFFDSISRHPIGYDALADISLVVAFLGSSADARDEYLLGVADSCKPTIRLTTDPRF